MDLPNTYTDKNETGCCSIPDVSAWDKQLITFRNKQFIRMYTKSFLYMPLNFGKIMKELTDTVDQSNAFLPQKHRMVLTRDVSPWKAEQLYGVSKPVDGADNVTLNGIFLTQVFEGPYQNAKQWYTSMQNYARDQGKHINKLYFFYTTCPKCAKHYGKNYVIGLADVTD